MPAATPPVVDLGAVVPTRPPASDGPRSATTRTGGTTRATPSARWSASRLALAARRPGDRGAFARAPALPGASCAAWTRASRRASAAVPRAQRKLVTDHDAFGYFAARYGIDVVGAVIPPATTVAQPSAGELGRLVETIEREHVRAVFPETLGQPEGGPDDRARDRRDRATTSCTATRSGPRAPAATLISAMEAANADAMVEGFTGGGADAGRRH